MRSPNPELEQKIRKECLALLLQKEGELIGMRDIASACGVSPTSIYYYFKDKEELFEAVKLDCIKMMDDFIRIHSASFIDPAFRFRAGLRAFRDWAFGNPRIAVLIMGRLKANLSLEGASYAPYYVSTDNAKALLDQAVAEGKAKSTDTRMDSSLCIAAVWGAIESILLNRTAPEYWGAGIEFTDRMIELCCSAFLIFRGEQ